MHRFPTGYAQDIELMHSASSYGFISSTIGFMVGWYLKPNTPPNGHLLEIEVYDSIGTRILTVQGNDPEALTLKAIHDVFYHTNGHFHRIRSFIPIRGFNNYVPELIKGHDGKANWDRMLAATDDWEGIPRLTDVVELI